MAASPSPSSDEQFALGSVLDGRYRIDAVLGTGGMGRVYRAEHTKIGKSVAIKVLHADLGRNREASQRFQREAIASGRLDHPNIVGVSDFGVLDDGAFYLVMEVLEGESLGDRLDRDHRIHWVEAIEILRGVLHGLRHAHERGVVHRDIKPDNVYLARKDGDPIIKILDFGIAKLYAGSDEDPAATRAGLTVGTPAYLSPEQAVGGEITPKSDLYSASILLYEMLAGRAPFEDKDPLAMLGAHVSRRPPAFAESAPGVEIPPPLEDIMQRGLMKMAADRIASAGDYLAMLDDFSPPIRAMPRFATSPGLALPSTESRPMPRPSSEALGTMATASPLDALAGSASGGVPAALAGSASGSARAPVPDTMSAAVRAVLPSSLSEAVRAAAAADPNATSRLPATPVPGDLHVALDDRPAGGEPHPAPTDELPAPAPSLATPVPGAATPVPGAATPVPATASALPVSPVSLEMAKLQRAKRAVSLADVVEPIPKTWIVRSGVFVVLAIVAAIVLAIAARCGGSSSTPSASSARPPAPPTAPTPAPTKPTPAATRPAAPATKPATPVATKPAAPAASAPAAPSTPAPGTPAGARPPAPSVPPSTPARTAQLKAPAAAPAATPAKPDPRDAQLKALVRELEVGRTCASRRAAIPKLVALRHAGAIAPLKKARYRLAGGVLGLGQRNYNACLTADAERAIKTLGALK